jgi:hypothetical protein
VWSRLQLWSLRSDDENSHAPAAGDERYRYRGLFGNTIRVVSLLTKVLDERRLFFRQRHPDGTARDRCNCSFHPFACATGSDA